MSAKAAREKLQKKRRATPGALQFSIMKLLDLRAMRLWRGSVQLAQQLRPFFEEWENELKSIGGCRSFVLDMAEGKCFSTLRNAVHFFSDPLFARRVGFRVAERIDEELEVDRQVAQTLWVFLVVLIGEIALTFFLYQTPPVLFALLTHPTEKVQNDAMKRR